MHACGIAISYKAPPRTVGATSWIQNRLKFIRLLTLPGFDIAKLGKLEPDKMLPDANTKTITEWAFQVVYASKNGGSLHFCVDFNRLKSVHIWNSYPIFHMKTFTDSSEGAEVFSIMSDSIEYCQHEMGEHAKDKTAFVTRHGIFRYKKKCRLAWRTHRPRFIKQ